MTLSTAIKEARSKINKEVRTTIQLGSHKISVLNRPASFSRLAGWLGCGSSSGWLG